MQLSNVPIQPMNNMAQPMNMAAQPLNNYKNTIAVINMQNKNQTDM
jgi:hypothetical protein